MYSNSTRSITEYFAYSKLKVVDQLRDFRFNFRGIIIFCGNYFSVHHSLSKTVVMKKIAITSFTFWLSFTVFAQEEIKPPKPPMAPGPTVEKSDVPPQPPTAPLPICKVAKVPQLPAAPTPPIPPPVNTTGVPPAPEVPPTSFDEFIDDDYKLFLKKNPAVLSLRWTKNSMIVRLKNGKEESYNLSDEKSVKEVEQKYGELPIPPPPPPPAKSRKN